MNNYEFWIDALARKVNENFPKEKIIHLSCGLSIRGPQHIGRIRGELCIPNGVKKVLEEKFGRKAIHYIVLYDMDPLKEKAAKLGFKDPEKQKKYAGVSLFNIEDPFGCHENWQEHFWEDFGNYLKDFGFDVEIVKTSEFYRMKETKELIKWILENREKVIEVVNKFRGRNPWPPNFIPINPICEECLTITDTEATGFDLDNYTVDYKCLRCGHKGTTSLENAKLNWRLEWPALWKILHIEFEPYGKDHAAAGGSRETCGYFSEVLFNYKPPLGEWNEWVSLKLHGKFLGEMTASGFIGITPKEWLEIAEPEILKYLYISTRPHTAITIDLDNLPVYYERYDEAERIYFGIEKIEDQRKLFNTKRAYELAQVKGIGKYIQKLPFTLACTLAQVFNVREEKGMKKALEILKKKGFSKEALEYARRRLIRALNWIEKYAPERFKLKVLEDVSKVRDSISKTQRKCLKRLSKVIKEMKKEDDFWTGIRKICEEEEIELKELFKAIYLVLIGKEEGPRFINLIESLGKEFIARRFEEI